MKKTSWKKVGIFIAIWFAVAMLCSAIFGKRQDDQKNASIENITQSVNEHENEDTDDEKKEDPVIEEDIEEEDEQQMDIEEEPVLQQTQSEPAAVSDPTPTEATTQVVEENPNLPLKATCGDGTIQYQDTPSNPNYRGMCSGHDGVKIRHGRVL